MSFDKDRLIELIDETELVPATGSEKPGWVYFIVCTDSARCKIGYTKGEPRKRLANLQTGSASELALLVVHPGTKDTERELHKKFGAHRLHGEWFELTDELRAYMVAALWAMSEFTLRNGRKLERWMTDGLILTTEQLHMMPEGLAEVLECGRP